MSVKMNGRHLAKFVADDEFDAIFPQVSLAHETLHGKTGPGSDFLGWVDLPVDYDKEEFARIKKAAARFSPTATYSSSSESAAAIWAPAPPLKR